MTEVSTTAIFVLLAAAAVVARIMPRSSKANRIIPLILALAALPFAFFKAELPISPDANHVVLLVAVLIFAIDGVLGLRPESVSPDPSA